MSYNNQVLLTDVDNELGKEKGIGYDIEDPPVAVTNANGVAATRTFDDLGRLLSRTYPDNTSEQFGYSARGLVSYTDALNEQTQYSYDEAGRRIQMTHPDNTVIPR